MSTSLAVLGPEARILLGAVSVGLGDDRPAPFDSGDTDPNPSPAVESLDWGRLYGLLDRERAAAALHPIRERLPIAPPPEWDQRFRAMGAVAGFRQRRLLDSLEDVVELLAARGIRVCLLKGAALALARYPDPLLRPMGDLDVLVERDRADQAWEALREEGWVWDRDRHPLELYAHRQHRPPLEAPGQGGRFVEIHDDLFVDGHPFGLSPGDLRSGAEEVEVGSVRAAVPAPTEHLVYSCIHLAWAHILATGGWRTFRDVAVLSAAPGFGWEPFVRLARQSRAARPCYWTLRLARRLGGVGVPHEVLASLEPAGLPSPAIRVLERHFGLGLFGGGAEEDGCPSVSLGRTLWRLGVQPPGSGDSGSVPWEHDEGFRRLQAERKQDAEASHGSLRRLAGHAARAGTWMRYLGAVLAGRGGSAPQP